MSLQDVRAVTVGALDRLMWQTQDVVDLLVRPNWGTSKHGYDRLLYGVVMNTMALADRLSYYRKPQQKQTRRMCALFQDMGADEEAAAVSVRLWRHSLMHTGDPMPFQDNTTGTTYTWLLHWGEEHLPRKQHLTFADGQGSKVLAFGALHAVADLRDVAEQLLTTAESDTDLATPLIATHDQLLAEQSKPLGLTLE